jgi:hypothetical protein
MVKLLSCSVAQMVTNAILRQSTCSDQFRHRISTFFQFGVATPSPALSLPPIVLQSKSYYCHNASIGISDSIYRVIIIRDVPFRVRDACRWGLCCGPRHLQLAEHLEKYPREL